VLRINIEASSIHIKKELSIMMRWLFSSNATKKGVITSATINVVDGGGGTEIKTSSEKIVLYLIAFMMAVVFMSSSAFAGTITNAIQSDESSSNITIIAHDKTQKPNTIADKKKSLSAQSTIFSYFGAGHPDVGEFEYEWGVNEGVSVSSFDVILPYLSNEPTTLPGTTRSLSFSGLPTDQEIVITVIAYGNVNGAQTVLEQQTHTYEAPNIYWITYNDNGGSGGPTNVQGCELTRNDYISKQKPTRSGYSFLGWASASSATVPEYNSGDVYTGGRTVTLYAVWQKESSGETHTITYDANGGTGAPPPQTVAHGTRAILSSVVPTWSGYTFLGWNTLPYSTSASYQPGDTFLWSGFGGYVESDYTLYAVWQKKDSSSFTITYDANGGKNAPGSQTKEQGKSITLSSAIPTRTGYTFIGWSTSKTATTATYQPGDTYSKDANVTLYAVWKESSTETYTITYDANGGTGAPAVQTKEKDKDLKLSSTKPKLAFKLTYDANGGKVSATSKTINCSFLYWISSLNGNGTRYDPGQKYTGNADLTLYANWGYPRMDTLPTPTRTDYTFEGWYTSASGGSKISEDTILMKDTTIYAHWKTTKVSRYLESTELFGFTNSGTYFGSKYTVSNSDFAKLSNYVRNLYSSQQAQTTINSLQEYREKAWSGSCYGMSLTTLLDKQNKIRFDENYGAGAKNMRGVPAPKQNKSVESAINYYQISWRVGKVTSSGKGYYNQWSSWNSGLKGLVDAAKKEKGFILNYGYGNYPGLNFYHAVVINGYEQASDGGHNLIVYNNWNPDKDYIIYVDKDFTKCIADHAPSKGIDYIWYMEDMSGLDAIRIDGTATKGYGKGELKSAGSGSNNAILSIKPSANSENITIKNKEGKYLQIKNGEMSGTMNVKNVNILPEALESGSSKPEFSLEVADSDEFIFESNSTKMNVSVQSPEIYGSAETTGADSVIISDDNGVVAKGNRVTYNISMSANKNAFDMVSVTGDSSNDVELKKNSQGIEAKGVDSTDGKLTVYSDTVDVVGGTYKSGYNAFLVKPGESGKAGDVDIKVSSKGDGVYDLSVGSLGQFLDDWNDDWSRFHVIIAIGKTVKVKAAKLKKKSLTISRSKALSVSNTKGKVSYKKVSGNKKIKINKKTGKITLKKGLKKGKYKLVVRIEDSGNAQYDPAAEQAEVIIKVK